jgi:hypothetical protein
MNGKTFIRGGRMLEPAVEGLTSLPYFFPIFISLFYYVGGTASSQSEVIFKIATVLLLFALNSHSSSSSSSLVVNFKNTPDSLMSV